MGVSPEDSLVPHQVVIDEFADFNKELTFITPNSIMVRVIYIFSWA